MWVEVTDGRTLGVPHAWFPRLLRATPDERSQVKLSRIGLHWEAIDEDISIAGLLARRGHVTPSTEHPARWVPLSDVDGGLRSANPPYELNGHQKSCSSRTASSFPQTSINAGRHHKQKVS